jgi:hypothetical protein
MTNNISFVYNCLGGYGDFGSNIDLYGMVDKADK